MNRLIHSIRATPIRERTSVPHIPKWKRDRMNLAFFRRLCVAMGGVILIMEDE